MTGFKPAFGLQSLFQAFELVRGIQFPSQDFHSQTFEIQRLKTERRSYEWCYTIYAKFSLCRPYDGCCWYFG